MTDTPASSRPWYRYPIVWMMLAIPFSAIVMGTIMMTLALESEDGLVSDDYYREGLGINQDISRDRRAVALGIHAELTLDNPAKIVTVDFFRGKLEQAPQSLRLSIQHATRANSDITIELQRGIGRQYIGHLQHPLSKGNWYFSLTAGEWKLISRQRVTGKQVIHLGVQ